MPTMPAQARDFGRGCCPGGKPGIHRRHSPISGKWPGGMSSVAVLGGGSAGGGCTGGGACGGGGGRARGGGAPPGGGVAGGGARGGGAAGGGARGAAAGASRR